MSSLSNKEPGDFCRLENAIISETFLLTDTNAIVSIFMGSWISQAEEILQLYCTWDLLGKQCSSRSNIGKFMSYQFFYSPLLKETY